MSKTSSVLALVSLVLAACGTQSRPQLTPVGDAIPADVSLAGRWQVRAESDAAEQRIREAEYKSSGGVSAGTAPATRIRSRRGGDEPSVYVFLRTGSKLKITQTPHGLFPFKHFFSSGYEADNGESVSSLSIKQKLQSLIDAENPKQPLSDRKLTDALAEQRFEVARRTVAKYREELEIPPSHLRRSY